MRSTVSVAETDRRATSCYDYFAARPEFDPKRFKMFTREGGGFHHCPIDNITVGTRYMWDWLEYVLKPGM